VWVPGAKTASVALAVLVVMAVVILVVRGYGDIMTGSVLRGLLKRINNTLLYAGVNVFRYGGRRGFIKLYGVILQSGADNLHPQQDKRL
ncbi:hypothetical protein LOS70_004812, partial [Salmonella enterica]|nr:hypothetical protein [Salmonella enterica]